MRLSQISGVSQNTAQSLYQAGFSTAEGVAYGFGPKVTAVKGVDAQIYLNAQELVADTSTASPSQALEREKYYCTYCDGDEFMGTNTFNTETSILRHMENCDDCPPGFGDLK